MRKRGVENSEREFRDAELPKEGVALDERKLKVTEEGRK